MKLIKVNGPTNHHLFKRIRSDGRATYWVRYSSVKKKGQLFVSLKTEFLEEARLARDEKIAEFLGKTPRHKKVTALVCDKFPEFISLQEIKSKSTFDLITNQWTNHLESYFGSMRLDEVNDTEWMKYVAIKRQTHPNRKFFNDRKYMSMFLHWLHRNGQIKLLPKLPDVDPEIKAGKIFSKEEVDRLLQFSPKNLQLQIICAVTMGMRLGEILSLEWIQIDFIKKTIHLPAEKTKIRKSRTFGISDKAYPVLNEHKLISNSRFVFPAPNNSNKHVGRTGNKSAWTSARRKAGVKGRFHDLRHTCITNAFKATINPAIICNYFGLSIKEAEKTYLHINSDDTRAVANLMSIEGND